MFRNQGVGEVTTENSALCMEVFILASFEQWPGFGVEGRGGAYHVEERAVHDEFGIGHVLKESVCGVGRGGG